MKLGDCLEKDSQGWHLFCCSNSSNSKHACGLFRVQYVWVTRITFECYDIAIPGLGIAVAAALGLAKVATMAITIYVKGMEAFFMMTKNPPQKLQEWCSNKVPQSCCSNRRKCVCLTINGICSTISSILLIFVTAFTVAGGMIVLTDLGKTDMKSLSFLLCSLLHLAHVAELITTDCRMFRPCRPLSTMQYVQNETSYISCYQFCYISAHYQFTWYQQCSNETLQHHGNIVSYTNQKYRVQDTTVSEAHINSC